MKRKHILSVLITGFAIVLLLFIESCGSSSQNQTQEESKEPEITAKTELPKQLSNKELARKWVEEIWGNKKFELVPELVSPNFTLHDPLGTKVEGAEAVGPWIGGWIKSFPDWIVDVRSLVSNGEYLGVYMWVGGTFTNDYKEYGLNIPANKLWKPRGTLDIWRISEGKIAEAWMSYDNIIFMQNVGFLPFELGPIVATKYDETFPGKEHIRNLQPQQISSSQTQSNVDLLDSLKESINSGTFFQKSNEYFANDIKMHFTGQPDSADYSGIDEINGWIPELTNACPDLALNFDLVIPDGDKIVVRWKLSGTFSGEYKGIEGNGNTIQTGGNSMLHFSNGKIAEIWHTFMRLQLMQQLGILPTQQ